MMSHNITTLEQKGFFKGSKREDRKFSTQKGKKFHFGKLSSNPSNESFLVN